MTTYRHPDTISAPKRIDPIPCPTCGAECMRCPVCRSPRVALADPGTGYWASCLECGYPIGAGE